MEKGDNEKQETKKRKKLPRIATFCSRHQNIWKMISSSFLNIHFLKGRVTERSRPSTFLFTPQGWSRLKAEVRNTWTIMHCLPGQAGREQDQRWHHVDPSQCSDMRYCCRQWLVNPKCYNAISGKWFLKQFTNSSLQWFKHTQIFVTIIARIFVCVFIWGKLVLSVIANSRLGKSYWTENSVRMKNWKWPFLRRNHNFLSFSKETNTAIAINL